MLHACNCSCCLTANLSIGFIQVGSPMTQKLQAMQQGVHQLRQVDQSCQYYLDVGQAVPEPDASQHMQRGWQLAKKCSSWANEVQVSLLPSAIKGKQATVAVCQRPCLGLF